MPQNAPAPILLADYSPYPFQIDRVHLTFRLDPEATRVLSRLEVTPLDPGRPMDLFGEDLKLVHDSHNRPKLAINGAAIDAEPLDETAAPYAKGIRINARDIPNEPFTLTCEVEINPSANTALEGLYMSSGMYSTQCEAEGFRRITYYPDRPDVMAPFTVRIESDEKVLLSNGNPTASGPGWAQWEDPWPKPAYLFALVAGDLVAHSDAFTTASGAHVALNIWVRPGDEHKCDYAMDALKRSMRWDEQVYGREYDLDVFNIVAVDDFNAGAMENKGLNIFNAKYVLASPETATDRDYELIEGIIAHEYFHNWTGNRITCRDWFQLCLKEGLTVFRDQQFSGDMRSHAVKRIDDVLMLRARQFREDNGPLAHPVRPESFVEINNFYTATVYEKGAEVIGMLKTLVGDAAYAEALDLYFDRHDGQACTIEDWLKVFEDATGRDLTQFALWYSQAGTPQVTVDDQMKDGVYLLHVSQKTDPTPGQDHKDPKVIPMATGLLQDDGRETLATTVLDVNGPRQTFAFYWHGDAWQQHAPATPAPAPEKPTPSLFRGFSAPVVLVRDTSEAERTVLLAHDTDPFNKWEAGRGLAKNVLIAAIVDDAKAPDTWCEALNQVLTDGALDPAFRALILALPREDDLAQTIHQSGLVPDPSAIHAARRRIKGELGAALAPTLTRLFEQMHSAGPYSPDAKSAGKRALRGAVLDLISLTDGGALASDLFAQADNMTESLNALTALLAAGHGAAELDAFYARWKDDRLVLDKWFMFKTLYAAPADAARATAEITTHPAFDWRNPNRFRSVLGGLAGNQAGFHHAGGAGYQVYTDWLLKLDPKNPQTAARMATVFETWTRYDADRQALICAQLDRMAQTPGLSRDMTEIVSRIRSA
ncbi:MAG: aminopeptidase N [Pseudomonadota bacterium]